MRVRGSTFVGSEFFLKPKSYDILPLYESNLKESSEYFMFSVSYYFPLISKDYETHIHSIAVFVKEGRPYASCFYHKNLLKSLTRFMSCCSFDHHSLLCTHFLILFHLTQKRFSPASCLLMYQSLKTLTPILICSG